MHELAVTESVLNLAAKHGIKAGAERITDINLVIGQLSSIIDDSIQFYWDIISEDTICEGAKLHFQRIPARLECLDCTEQYNIETELSPCPNCGSYHVKVITGDEFFLESIEINRQT